MAFKGERAVWGEPAAMGGSALVSIAKYPCFLCFPFIVATFGSGDTVVVCIWNIRAWMNWRSVKFGWNRAQAFVVTADERPSQLLQGARYSAAFSELIG